MHAGKPFSDRVLWTVFLLLQSLDPPDIGKEFDDLIPDVITISLGHDVTISAPLACLRRI